MAKAKIEHPDGRFRYAAAAAHKPGDVVTRPDGTYAIFDGLEGCASGEMIQPQPIVPGPTVIMEKSVASDNIAANTVLYVIPATGKVTATSTENVRVGKSIAAAGVGVTTVHINPQA